MLNVTKLFCPYSIDGFFLMEGRKCFHQTQEKQSEKPKKNFLFRLSREKKFQKIKKKLFNSICGLNGEETKLRSEGASVNVSSV